MIETLKRLAQAPARRAAWRGAELARESALVTPPPRLKVIELPAGEVRGIDVAWIVNNRAEIDLQPDWLAEGFEGVLFRGQGPDLTRIVPNPSGEHAINVGMHDGTVAFDGVDIVAGWTLGARFGQQNTAHQYFPRFKYDIRRSRFSVPAPTTSGRTKWPLFAYNCDGYMESVEVEAFHASQHCYHHGFAKRGTYWRRVRISSIGGQGYKARCPASETRWAGRDVWIVLDECDIVCGYEAHADFGGAAVVLEGSGANFYARRCVFRGGEALGSIPAHARSKCVMVTSQGGSYDAVTGGVDVPGGYGNGWVLLEQNAAAAGGDGPSWYSPLCRVGAEAGSVMRSARGLLVRGNGLWGKNMSFQMDSLPAGMTEFSGNNTPKLREWAMSAGLDAEDECSITTHDRVIPISEGFRR